jgi:hypothetical protein
MENGIYHWSNGEKEFIEMDKIEKVSVEVEKKNLTVPEILIGAVQLRGSRNVTMNPPPSAETWLAVFRIILRRLRSWAK